VQLTTERLVLRDFVPDDIDAYFAIQSDPRWLTYYEWAERDRNDCQELMDRFIAWQHEEPRTKFQLAITLDGIVIGSCGARDGEIGYELHPDHWGHGYATESAQAMVDFSFEELGHNKLTSWCIADNLGSVAVLTRLGFVQTERKRDTEFFKGRHWDTLRFELRR